MVPTTAISSPHHSPAWSLLGGWSFVSRSPLTNGGDGEGGDTEVLLLSPEDRSARAILYRLAPGDGVDGRTCNPYLVRMALASPSSSARWSKLESRNCNAVSASRLERLT